MELFYGESFAFKPGEFKFTLGEKILITQIKQHVAQKGFKYFAVGKKKMNMSKLIETAVGLIFGAIPKDTNREKSIPTKSVKSGRSTENYEQKLLASANKVTNKRLREIGKAERVLTADLVQIDESIDANIKGYVSCVFCKEMKKVSFKQSAGNWIMSNFIDHLRKCSENVKQSEEGKEVTSTSKCDLILTEPKNILPVTLTDDGQTHNNQSPQKCVFLTDNLVRQLSLQNIKMKNAVARDKAKIVDRFFRTKVCEVVSHISMGVCEISMDGNCLFNAVCQQRWINYGRMLLTI